MSGAIEQRERPDAALPGTLGIVTFTRITVDSERMSEVPCVRGLRFPVATVVAMMPTG